MVITFEWNICNLYVFIDEPLLYSICLIPKCSLSLQPRNNILFLFPTASDAFIGSKLKQIAFVFVFKSKKQIGVICFSFCFKITKAIWFVLVLSSKKQIDLICFSFEFKKTKSICFVLVLASKKQIDLICFSFGF